MKQSGLLARQKAERQELLNAGMRIEKQFMLDTLQMSLHQLGWGYKRIKELTDLWGEIYNDYHIALEGKTRAMCGRNAWTRRSATSSRISRSFSISAADILTSATMDTTRRSRAWKQSDGIFFDGYKRKENDHAKECSLQKMQKPCK